MTIDLAGWGLVIVYYAMVIPMLVWAVSKK